MESFHHKREHVRSRISLTDRMALGQARSFSGARSPPRGDRAVLSVGPGARRDDPRGRVRAGCGPRPGLVLCAWGRGWQGGR